MSRLHRGRKALQQSLHTFGVERGLADPDPDDTKASAPTTAPSAP